MKLSRLLAHLSLLIATASAVRAATFHFVQCPDSPETHLTGVSNNSVAVGYCLGGDGIFHALVAAGGRLNYIDHPKGVFGTFFEDVNSDGTIAGFYIDDAITHHAFSYSYRNQQFRNLDPPLSALAFAFGVDERGRVSGESEDEHGFFHGWFFDGAFHVVDLGLGVVAIRDLNANDWATVVWQDQPPVSRSSIYHDGKLTEIVVPGSISTVAHAINSTGDAVLSWTDEAFIDHAAALIQGKLKKFDAPGCDTTVATGINDNRVIVGSCSAGGVIQGFYVSY